MLKPKAVTTGDIRIRYDITDTMDVEVCTLNSSITDAPWIENHSWRWIGVIQEIISTSRYIFTSSDESLRFECETLEAMIEKLLSAGHNGRL